MAAPSSVRPSSPKGEDARYVSDLLIAAADLRPYYSRALAALTPLVVTSGALDGSPAAVDKYWRLYLDIACLKQVPLAEAAAIIAAHEVEHVLRDHSSRGAALGVESIDHRAWNVCADAEINDDARDILPPEGSPLRGVYPETLKQPENMTAEEYYRALPTQTVYAPSCGSGGGGEPHECELPGPSQGAKGTEQTPGLTPEEAEALRDLVAVDVQYHEAANPGSVPAGLRIWAEARCKPVQIDWRRGLVAEIRKRAREYERGREDYTWRRLSRRTRPLHPIRPGTHTPLPRIGVVVDTSGSMGELGSEVVSTVTSLARSSGSVRVWQGDTKVTGVSKGAPKEWIGGGGTDLQPAVDAASKQSDVLIVVTDGELPGALRSELPMVAVVPADAPEDVTEWAAKIVRLPSAAGA